VAEPVTVLRLPLIEGNKTPAQVTEDVCAAMERRPTVFWWAGFSLALAALLLGVVATGGLKSGGCQEETQRRL